MPSENSWAGYWWLWPAPVVVEPWHSAGTWSQLRKIGRRQGVDVDTFIRWLAKQAPGNEATIVLLGYPIPDAWHDAPSEVHWQAILPPQVPKRVAPMNGFRDNERGRNHRLQKVIFGGAKTLSYLKTANWHPDRLQARGRLPARLRNQATAIIGAGALGSAIAELLGRAGVSRMLLVDHDDLEAGNLVRHTLTSADLGRNKAGATVERLRLASPMAHITASTSALPQGRALAELLEPFELVLDCSGEDDVLRRLGAAWWPVPRSFVSVSLGVAAQRLFLFYASACAFPFDDFADELGPWLSRERAAWRDAGETLEGAGCWSPLFPARVDDVWLAAVAAVKFIERLATEELAPGLHVLEQREGKGTGFEPAELREQP